MQRRLWRALPTLLGITFLAFALVRAAPGEPSALSEGLRAGSASLSEMREYRRRMGLDDPLLEGYLRWLSHLLVGDLG
ncbi:MAG TPA: hypothetical protein VI356_04325, partial [Myxococcales bacterium]